MSRRHIVIAEHVTDVVIVTPRTPHAARGVEADAITVTSSMHDDPRVHDLIQDAEPALIGSERRPEGAWDAMLAAEARDAAQPSALERRQALGRLTKLELIDAVIAAEGIPECAPGCRHRCGECRSGRGVRTPRPAHRPCDSLCEHHGR